MSNVSFLFRWVSDIHMTSSSRLYMYCFAFFDADVMLAAKKVLVLLPLIMSSRWIVVLSTSFLLPSVATSFAQSSGS